jgi:hydroxymethylpyrimidine/phosphomethylpyrimidine kinase
MAIRVCFFSPTLPCGPNNAQTSVIDAVESATAYTYRGIETAEPIGKGHGPLNHLHSMSKILIPGY